MIKNFFKNIDRDDINESMDSLVSDGVIDSLDIMALVSEIEKHYKRPLDAKFIDVENFESFESIRQMIEKAFK